MDGSQYSEELARLLQECIKSRPDVTNKFGSVVREPKILRKGVSCFCVEIVSRSRDVMFVRDKTKDSWLSVLPPRPKNFDPWVKCHPVDFLPENLLGSWGTAFRSSADHEGLYYKIKCEKDSYVVRCMMRECQHRYLGIKICDDWYIDAVDVMEMFNGATQIDVTTDVRVGDGDKALNDIPCIDYPWNIDGRVYSIIAKTCRLPDVALCEFYIRDHVVRAFVDTDRRKIVIVKANTSEGISFDDVCGMNSVKEYVKTSVLAPLRDPEKAKKYGLKRGGGLLLYGLPGTGKTFFAKAVAGELKVPFFAIGSNDIFGKYIGDSEKKIKEIFAKARTHPMSVIFIDEIDAILRRRSDDLSETRQDVVNIILQECDGINSKEQNPFFLIGATNYPMRIDDAALSRFGAAVEIPLPDLMSRKSVIRSELYKMDVIIDVEAIAWLVTKTTNWSMRDICSLMNLYRQQAYIIDARKITTKFCMKHFRNCKNVSSSVENGIDAFRKRVSAS